MGASVRRRAPLGLTVGALATAALFASPLAFIVIQNVRTAGQGDSAWTDGVAAPLGRSIMLAAAVAAGTAVLGTGLAWLIVRTNATGRRFWAVMAPLPLVFPSFVGATALLTGFARGGFIEQALGPIGIDQLPELRGFWGAWFVLTLFTYPYLYLPVAARMRKLPSSIEDGARMLGRSSWSVFFTVVLPQLRSAISAGALLVFLYTISDFGAVQLLRYDTLTRVIYANGITNPPRFYALALLLGVVAIAVVAIERVVDHRDPPTMARSAPSRGNDLGRWRFAAGGGLALFFLISIGGPAASLGYWVIRGVSSSRTRGATALDTDGLGAAVINTVGVSIVAAAVTVLIVLPAAYLSVRHRSRVGSIATTLVVAGFALPGIVIALALVYWTLRWSVLAALYQTLPLLVLAYVVHFGSQATRSAAAAVNAVSPRIEDAARTLGAGRARRLYSIEAPIILPGLAAAFGLVLLSTMKELPATIFLRPTGFDTLATQIWGSMESLAYANAGLESLVLLAVSSVLTWTLVIRPQRA